MKSKSIIILSIELAFAPAARSAFAATLLPLLLLIALPAGASAADFTYTTSNNQVTITGYTGPGGPVIIPSTIDGFPVTTIGYEAFRAGSLTSVTIPNSVTNIGHWAFAFCASLDAITVDALNTFYSSVDGILFDKSQTTLIQYPGGKAGAYTIPNSVTTIGSWAFVGWNKLTSITIGNSVTSIGYYAFADCNRLANVTIANSVTIIGDGAFVSCSSLTNVVIPNGVTSIGNHAFNGCASLTNVTIANSVTSIGNSTFGNCRSLTSVTIPNSVISIGKLAFEYCISLDQITVEALNTSYSSVDGVLFNKNQTTLLQYLGGKAGSSYTIPNSVTNIEDFAFSGCTSLISITLPNSVATIGDGAFNFCSSLASVNIPNSITTIGGGAFAGCSSLTSITIPDSVTAIGDGAFYYCGSLTSVTIPIGVTSIGQQTFEQCGSLTSVTIPSGVTIIGDYAFYGCSHLASVTIPNGVITIGEQAFQGCASLISITIPNSVTTIGNGAFAECGRLSGIYFRGNPPSMDESAIGAIVYHLPATTGWISTSLWDEKLQIGYNSDNGTITITGYNDAGGALAIPEMIDGLPVTQIALSNCSTLTSVTIPNSVTSIGERAFAGCTSLASVNIPKNVSTIGNGAFGNCPSLTSVTIPNSVTAIGDGAFGYCASLTGVYFAGNLPGSVNLWILNNSNQAIVYYLPGTTGWSSMFGDRPAVLWNPQAVTSDPDFGVRAGQFGFTITGTPDIIVVIEATPGLANPIWTPISTNTLTGGSSQFTDPQWTNDLTRIYRLRSP